MKNILRWIAVLPVSFVAYAVVKAIALFGASEWMSEEVIAYLNTHRDLGPYEIRGSLYVIFTQFPAAAFAMIAAQKIAPSGKKRLALFITGGVWLMMSLFSLWIMNSNPQPAGIAFRTYLGMLSEAAGIIMVLCCKPDTDKSSS
jgi:hypothetical protein